MDFPNDFINNTKQLMGEQLFNQLKVGLSEDAITSIRVNPFKCSIQDIDKSIVKDYVPWCENGIYLTRRPNFTFDPLLHAGLYYVQEASSMFIDHIIRQYIKGPVMMLDLCAAPGGKSTTAITALPQGSLLISNEPIRNRAQILSENINKFGNKDVIVTNNYPEDFKKSKLLFDVILTDVPCSGEGMFRKDETAIKEWSTKNVENCFRKQREIVNSIWGNLKPNGLLIYSTCTFNAKEDEENVKWIANELGADILPVDIKSEWDITGSLVPEIKGPVYRFIPGKTKGEGLFVTVLRKKSTDTSIISNDNPFKLAGKKKGKEKKANKDIAYNQLYDTASKWLKESTSFHLSIKGDSIVAIPERWQSIYEMALKSLKILSAGITIGSIKGKDIIPDQSLALSIDLNKDAFPQIDLNYHEAIDFLRKEAVSLPIDTPHGLVLIKYKGQPLGFEKNIGNRANNLYPMEWKIRSTHIPENNNEIIKIKNNI